MPNPFLVLPLVIFAGFAGIAYWGMQRTDSQSVPSAMIGSHPPKISLEPLAGQVPFVASDLASGQVALVNFWASWCGPCRAEHPTLVDLAERGVPIFGVNYRDAPEKAQAFLAELGTPYDFGGADPQAKMALDWGVYGLPETFVLAPDGQILARVAGPLTQRNLEARVLPVLIEHGLKLPD